MGSIDLSARAGHPGADNAKGFNDIAYVDCDVRLIAGLMVRVANNSKRCV